MCSAIAALLAHKDRSAQDTGPGTAPSGESKPAGTFYLSDEDLDKFEGSGACHLSTLKESDEAEAK
jgi:hypothetical protein